MHVMYMYDMITKFGWFRKGRYDILEVLSLMVLVKFYMYPHLVLTRDPERVKNAYPPSEQG
jgi:hypothetical protein